MQIMADKYVTEMFEVVEQSKNSAVRIVLQARIEKSGEDPTSWDVEACQRILADLPNGQPERKDEEKITGSGMLEGNEGGPTSRSECEFGCDFSRNRFLLMLVLKQFNFFWSGMWISGRSPGHKHYYIF